MVIIYLFTTSYSNLGQEETVATSIPAQCVVVIAKIHSTYSRDALGLAFSFTFIYVPGTSKCCTLRQVTNLLA